MLHLNAPDVSAGFISRSIRVGRILEIVRNLPVDASLYPNRVGNLSVVLDGNSIGFIDIAEEVFVREQDDRPPLSM